MARVFGPVNDKVNKPVSSQVNVVESKSLFHEPSNFGLDTFSGSAAQLAMQSSTQI